MRQVQDHPSSWFGDGDLFEPATQAATGLAFDSKEKIVARIAGVDLPRDKRLDISLTYIYGVGRSKATETCMGARVDPATRVRDLTDEEVVRIRDWIGSNYQVEGDLRRDVNQNIKRKVEIGSYQGLRHRRGLPVNGQRTHTNARTRKGPKKVVAGKKKAKK
jgi:small subunit ribosomal protein S13